MARRRVSVAMALLPASLFASGCVGRAISGEDEGIAEVGGDDVGDDVGDDIGDDVVDDGDDDDPGPSCPQVALGPELPVTVSVDTSTQTDDFVASCEDASGPSPDFAVEWSAPFDGRFVAYTSGSSFDPLIAVLDGGCFGAELACNDDAAALEAAVQVDAYAGQVFEFVVGAFTTEVGTTTLTIEEVESGVCPDATLESAVPLFVSDDSTTAADRGGSSCGGFGGPDRLYLFAPPADGVYGFEVAGQFDPILQVYDGECTFSELACSNDQLGTSWPGLALPSFAGQVLTLGVDSASASGGSFGLVADRVHEGVCPELFLGASTPALAGGFTGDGVNATGSACGGWASLDRSFQWSAPAAGTYRVEIDADFDWVLSAFDGSCEGPMLACTSSQQSGGLDGSIVVQAEAGQVLAIAVDGLAGSVGNFEMVIDEFEGCAANELPGDPPVSIVGSTVSETADNAGSCAPTDASPEIVFSFVPAQSGTYRMYTEGSSYDTVLYVRAGDCLGPELACNDDIDADITSELVVDLVAGQPVYLFVDGYGGDAGPYQLTIEPT